MALDIFSPAADLNLPLHVSMLQNALYYMGLPRQEGVFRLLGPCYLACSTCTHKLPPLSAVLHSSKYIPCVISCHTKKVPLTPLDAFGGNFIPNTNIGLKHAYDIWKNLATLCASTYSIQIQYGLHVGPGHRRRDCVYR